MSNTIFSINNIPKVLCSSEIFIKGDLLASPLKLSRFETYSTGKPGITYTYIGD